MKAAESHNVSYEISYFLGKERQHKPSYIARIHIAYSFNCYYADFIPATINSSGFADKVCEQPGFITHSPDLLIYLAQQINRLAINEGLQPFDIIPSKKISKYKTYYKWTNTSYPTPTEINEINCKYKREYSNYKKGDSYKHIENEGVIHLFFRVDAK